MLHESSLSETRRSSLWTWKKRLGVEASEFDRILEALHVYELANASGATIELNADSTVWMDYLRAHYQIEVAGQQRALTVANLMLETLKRAPQAMARKYLAAGIGRPDKYTRIFSGFKMEPFLEAKDDPALRTNLGFPSDAFVIGKIGRMVENGRYGIIRKVVTASVPVAPPSAPARPTGR